MFKKKPNIKPLSPLRSSDRRKIADQIISTFNIELPKAEEIQSDGNDQTTVAASLGSLRNSLLPDNSLSARFTTTAGPNLSPVSGTVYVGAHPGEEQRVLWIKIEEKLIPTVYTLWRHPQLVPLLHTPDFVLQKLRGGADLMTPGLAGGPPFPSKAIKDSIVAVASLEKPSVPMVVGVCVIDVASLQQVQGAKGHAVRGEHWDGDEIWAWSPGGKPGGSAPNHIDGWDPDDRSEQLSPGIGHLSMEDPESETEGGVSLDVDHGQSSKLECHNNFVAGEDGLPYEALTVDEKELSIKEIDEAFRKALLYGLYDHQKHHKKDPRQGLNFPIHQSLIISNFVLPFLPISTPAQAVSLQIKKTSWKNAKKFIKALDKQKLVKSKDRDGSETVVMDINFDDPAVTTFVPYHLPKKETASVDHEGGGNSKSTVPDISPSDSSIGQRLSQITLFKPKDQLAPLFKASNSTPKALFLSTELRPIITSYIESEHLVSPTNKRLVNLDPILANAVFDSRSSLDSEVLAKGSVPRDALIDRIFQSCCSPFWAILRNDETREDVKAKAGTAPKIQIVLETRSGNKTVTKLSGVEVFYISPQPLAEELQKACASSTGVGQLAGSSPKHPVMEIMVQGPQKDMVVKALERRGIKKDWIEVLDKTKGKKR